MSTPPRESWEALQRRQVQPVSTDGDDETVMLAVTGLVGERFMEWLRKTYIEARCRPGATEAELREAEAKRALVFDLETRRDRALGRSKKQ
jgi:hypothetical protein